MITISINGNKIKTIESIADVFDNIRRQMSAVIANEIIGVQPMGNYADIFTLYEKRLNVYKDNN